MRARSELSPGPALRRLVVGRLGPYPSIELKARVTRAWPTNRAWALERSEARHARRTIASPPKANVVTVIPTYRRPELLARAVDSALAQTVEEHIVLVVDDAGGLPPLPSDPRLFTVSLRRNIGVAGAVRNVGIRISDSRYLAFLDDDNEWYPNHLRVALERLDAGADLVYTGIELTTSSGAALGVLSEPFDRRRLRTGNYVDTSSVVVRRSRAARFSRVPRRRSDPQIEDWELVYRFSRRHRVEHVPDVTVRYLAHDASYFSSWNVTSGAIGSMPRDVSRPGDAT